jgi:hypothetical protein
MTQEDKELLLKDLCARLPYSVKCEIDDIDEPLELESIKFKGDYFIFGNGVYERYIIEFKPYLRPMSSMTEEEKKELGNFVAASMFASQSKNSLFQLTREALYGDFFNKHHFDYRRLIEKGLALEAPEGMYNIKGK